MKLILLDYDGTISPIDVGLEKAYPSAKVLESIDYTRKKGNKVAIVSTKSCDLLINRVKADAYACIAGAEIIYGNRSCIDTDLIKYQDDAISLIDFIKKDKDIKESKAKIDIKKTTTNLIAGITIDWRFSNYPKSLPSIIEQAKKLNLKVIKYENEPFIDILVSKANKADAVLFLKTLFNPKITIYFGDSENDLPAFKVSDISILVLNKYNEHLKNAGINEIVEFDKIWEAIRKYADY
ncbi:HAD-IIB family hydrolase [Caldisphaera sp.]|uniref:HAD-IIB family hydrolase n=1 Tax=Caldisphaera sp. TaxID=2060322 RepID=UPI003D12A11F